MTRRAGPKTTPAKVNPPSIGEVYPRKGLFRVLDAVRSRPIVWLQGPAGSGKTTLVASYLKTRHLPSVWFQTDEGDADPASFFYYLGLAAKQAVPRKRKPLPVLTPEYLSGLATFSVRCFEALSERLPPSCVIVFDNYQDLGEAAAVHHLIRSGLQGLRPGLNLIVVSRDPPPPAFMRTRAASQMGLVGWNELRLSSQETRGIARSRMGSLSTRTVERLHAIADGWVAGLILMLEQARTEGLEGEWLFTIRPEEVFDYFGAEIFSKFDPQTRDFLLRSSFLHQMDVRAAGELSGQPNAGRILARLYRRNLFTERRLGNVLRYQYHPLFREFLQARAEKALADDQLRTIRREAGRILEERGEIHHAVDLFRCARDWGALAALIMAHAPEMLAQGRNQVLQSWLTLLPREVMVADPWLFFWLGACELPFSPSSSQSSFRRALELFRRREDASGCFLAWSGCVDSILFSMEAMDRLDALSEEFDRLVETFQDIPPGQVEARVALGVIEVISFSVAPI